MKKLLTFGLILFFGWFTETKAMAISDTLEVNYTLEATMLGYFAKDGTRNPTLRAPEGSKVKITIINGETMTHDISLEKQNIKSETILEKGSSTSITFIAKSNDTYYCSIPGHRAAGMVGKFEISKGKYKPEKIISIEPKAGKKKLNFDFETGTLTHWTATGEAFKDPLVSNEPSENFEPEMRLGYQGKYGLSSGGTAIANLTGTLQSEDFKVSYPFASFLVSGGALADTRVELILKETDETIFKTTGQGRATLQPVVVDLSKWIGQNIYIKIIDNETGISQIPYIPHDKWAHINFDHFVFHKTRPNFQNELKVEDIIALPPLDPVLHAGLSGKEAAAAMSLPPDFKIQIAAAEPDIVRPISFTIDHRGRLWVVEGHTYPTPAPEGQGKDRILIFEDTDGDGTLDSRKVFMENLNLVSGIELGMGGVWLCAAPYFMFVPTDFEQDKPLGKPQILLDGWGTHDTHEVLNNIRWGPDGWLYGVHGVFTHSNVGKPGASDTERTKINAGVWRYHPSRHEFEVFAEGTSNPWGIDFNDMGHAFITVCVIPHMYHMIQGARYQRQAGTSFNPYTYEEIQNIGDHVHYLGNRGPHAGNFRSAAAGGGHAHAGAMIYLGNEQWPSKYRNTIFMNNINGAKLNNDILTREGSGYLASHGADFLSMNDSWSQWLNMKYDQNGSVWAIDWYDKNQCHSANPDVHDKTLGRIFKLTHKTDGNLKIDMRKLTDAALVNYHLHANEYFVRQARLILQERGKNDAVINDLTNILKNQAETNKKLRALWTLHAIGGLTETELRQVLKNEDENIRAWAIQLLTENKKVSRETLADFQQIAQNETSPLVRLYLLSGLMRLPFDDRWVSLELLSKKEMDTDDHNIPSMWWYAAEPLAEKNMERFMEMAEKSVFAKHLPNAIKRVGAIGNEKSKQALLALQTRLGHEKHVVKMLIDEILKNENK